MTLYKIHITDRNYSTWSFFDIMTSKNVCVELPNVCPTKHRLFSNDVFNIDPSGNVIVEHSSTRIAVSMPGVLILKDNKTYGRSKDGKKMLYKCIPDDMRIPAFLIPYNIKEIGFSKLFENIYVTFSFTSWTDKHPIGMLNQSIGPVNILDNFYEYQLYCKSLNSSIQKFTKDTTHALKTKSHEEFIETICKKYPNIQDRTDWHVFTIDPQNSLDFDDGFSIKQLEQNSYHLSIYISNVTIWLDVLNLWDSFSRRISTIYLPDRKRPMLPTILSDCLCSLQQGNTRLAFVMDLFINDKSEIERIEYTNCAIRVRKNYSYEESSLHKNADYNLLLEITKGLSKKYKYISSVRNSHDVVCYLMILMNFHCAKEFIPYNNGIFRSTVMQREVNVPDDMPDDVTKFIKIWNSSSGQYINANTITKEKANEALMRHELLEMDAYIHITSPIRRLVDLLNIIKFQQNSSLLQLSENATRFYEKWTSEPELEYINVTMRAIRKVQNDCSLLDLCLNNPTTMEQIYEGYTFDKLARNDGLFQYIVFLPNLKLVTRITVMDDIENYSKRLYKLYLFNDENKLKKKIRLNLV